MVISEDPIHGPPWVAFKSWWHRYLNVDLIELSGVAKLYDLTLAVVLWRYPKLLHPEQIVFLVLVGQEVETLFLSRQKSPFSNWPPGKSSLCVVNQVVWLPNLDQKRTAYLSKAHTIRIHSLVEVWETTKDKCRVEHIDLLLICAWQSHVLLCRVVRYDDGWIRLCKTF